MGLKFDWQPSAFFCPECASQLLEKQFGNGAWLYKCQQCSRKLDKHEVNQTSKFEQFSLSQQARTGGVPSFSGYRGVHYLKKTGMYQGRIAKDGQQHFLGLFKNPTEAAIAYNKKALELFGPRAYQNEIPQPKQGDTIDE